MPKMRVVAASRAGGPFEMVERDIPEPTPGSVRIKVAACGICHSDSLTKEGVMLGIQFPRVPGHEVIGTIDAVGRGVALWRLGQRVGVGWNGGYCGYCENCRRGNFFACQSETRITGITYDGGYAEYMLADASALAAVPDGLSDTDAAPLMCAGLTTYNAWQTSGARAGDLVAVLGVGGLGHLGVQFAARMGFRTVAIARGQEKAPLARRLGAFEYIDSTNQDPAQELLKLGGAQVVLATVIEGSAMTATIAGLAPRGTLMVLGAPHHMEVAPGLLIAGARTVRGWYSGTSIDAQDTLAFSQFAGVRSMNEMFPFERAPEAYDWMMSGKARFRAVLSMSSKA